MTAIVINITLTGLQSIDQRISTTIKIIEAYDSNSENLVGFIILYK